jgi:8-oxo-dGTP pyrophosphatase MutT (NUDIX family)
MLDLAARLRRALAGPLPGVEAQLRMAPRPRVGWDPYRIPPGLREAGALVLLYPHDAQAHLPLTVRGAALRTHTGQVSLPGGGVNDGETIEAAALREAAEEVGILPSSVEVVGRLTPLHIPVSGFLLHPVVGVARERPPFRPAAHEVARLLEVPVTRLGDSDAVVWERRTFGRDGTTREVEVPYFAIEGEKVWGATAMVLAEFVEVLATAAGREADGRP